jgi:hypothetical protein
MTQEEKIKNYRLAYTKITNKTLPDGADEFPILPCEISVIPDYLCLYKNVKDYNKTDKTCLCFYEYDKDFDGINGLFNAIYYDDKKLLDKYKDRFKNVWMVIEPDYSQVRDIEIIENKYRQFKARIVGLWFLTELQIPVIPNINYADEYSFSYMLDGIRDSKTLAISLKGIMKKTVEENLLKKVIKYVVDNTKVSQIIIYSTGIKDEKINEYFSYAKKKNIKYYVTDNSLRLRNLELQKNKKQ